jgi:hypothetical protein
VQQFANLAGYENETAGSCFSGVVTGRDQKLLDAKTESPAASLGTYLVISMLLKVDGAAEFPELCMSLWPL